MKSSSTRVKLCVLGLGLISVFSLFHFVFKVVPLDREFIGQDQVSQFEGKLQALRAELGGEDAIGYVGDHSIPSDAEQQSNFQITQYVLAPMLLTEKRPTRYLIGVRPLEILKDEIEKRGLVLVKDFGNDVRLFERRAP